jgi:hypothetical protein
MQIRELRLERDNSLARLFLPDPGSRKAPDLLSHILTPVPLLSAVNNGELA